MKTRKLDIIVKEKVVKKDFEIPEAWSDRAAKVVATKYAMDYENSALDIIDRVVEQIGEWGWAQGYFDNTYKPHDDKSLQEFKKNLKDILINQRASFNSPVWFNCGVPENSNQMSACFIFPVEDTMEDILAHTSREGTVFRSGSGAGVNVSKLRASGEKLSNKGTASGPISFMKTWDANAGSIKSGGKTRRSAKMVCMDVDHPDIMEFINCKVREEEKAKMLIEAGIVDTEAYATVAFQNTNHSIRVTDDFMEAVIKDQKWDLVNRGDGCVAKTVNAKDILRKAAEATWAVGDPGIQYNDRMNDDNPVPSLDKIRSTNPCSEFSAVDNSSCNLASMNLVKYIDMNYSHSINGFYEQLFADDIKIMITAMDILIDAADYPTPEVRNITTRTRPLGLGFTNLGAYLMIKGIPYDSDTARSEASRITKLMTTAAYEQSIHLASKMGSFAEFKENESTCLDIAMRLTETDETDSIWQDMKSYGLRNSQLTLLAPTGTISFMMDCDTTGIEPLIAETSIKTSPDGSTMEHFPNCVQIAKDTYNVYLNKILETAIGENIISWKAHIDMMAACQPYLNGAISKTVNMPADCTVDDIEDAYIYGWRKGCKAIAVYKDGSKGMQPLTTTKEKEPTKTKVKPEVYKPFRNKLLDTNYGPNHKFDIAGFKGHILTGTYEDGSLGEVFIIASKAGSSMQGLLDSFAIAISLSLQYGVPIEKLVDKFKDSTFLPSGITRNEDIQTCSSIIDYIFRWIECEFLDNHQEETEKEIINIIPIQKISFDGPPCLECGSMTQRQGTCFVCSSCGFTNGCS